MKYKQSAARSNALKKEGHDSTSPPTEIPNDDQQPYLQHHQDRPAPPYFTITCNSPSASKSSQFRFFNRGVLHSRCTWTLKKGTKFLFERPRPPDAPAGRATYKRLAAPHSRRA